MKWYSYLLIFALGFASCADDDDSFDPYVLKHDGENSTSPNLPPGEFEAAVHFTVLDIDQYPGKELIAIDYNVYEVPDRAEIRVSESNGSSVPGNIIFSRDVTNEINPFGWNTVNLGTPIPLEGGLWLSLYFENSVDDRQTIGCDGGPGSVNGDWLFDSYDNQWLSYRSRTGESINWNIRGVLQDQ